MTNHFLLTYSILVNDTAATEKHIFQTELTNQIEVADQFIQNSYDEVSINEPGVYYSTKGSELTINVESVKKVAEEDVLVLRKYI